MAMNTMESYGYDPVKITKAGEALPPELANLNPAELRAAISARIEAHADAMNVLLVLLDFMDGDPDLEPMLGSPEVAAPVPFWLSDARSDEGSQIHWADGCNSVASDDSEVLNQGGGDIPGAWVHPLSL